MKGVRSITEVLKRMSLKSIYSDQEIQIRDFVVTDTKYWFVVNRCNKLFYYDMKDKKLCMTNGFFKEKINRANLFRSVEEYKGKIFFIPLTAEHIYVYNIAENKMESIELELEEGIACRYSSSFRHNNFLYLTPMCCRNLIKLDTEDFNQKSICNVENLKNISSGIKIYFINDVSNYDDTFITSISECNKIWIFNATKEEYMIREFKDMNHIISNCMDDYIMYFLERKKGRIVQWNTQTDETDYIEIDYSLISEQNMSQVVNIRDYGCVYSLFRNKCIYVCTDMGNVCLKINLDERKAYTVFEGTYGLPPRNGNSKLRIVGDNIVFFCGTESSFISIDKEDIITKEKVLMKENMLADLKKEASKERILEEDFRLCNIDMLMNLTQDKPKHGEKGSAGAVGTTVYEMIKGEV